METKGEILITGGGGFIGANLAHGLVRLGFNPHLFVRTLKNDWRIRSIRKKIGLYECDLTDERKVHRLVRQIRPKYIFHCATYGGYSFQTDPRKILTTNIFGTFNLVNACLRRGFEVFVNTGSSSEYGFKNFPCDETTLPEPNSDYAVSKISSTLYCQYVAKTHRLPIITFRLYSVYGPYEEPRRFIPTLIRSSFQKKYPSLVAPETARDFIHVDDAVKLYLKTMRRRVPFGEIFNVCTGKQSTVRDVVQEISRLTAFRFKLDWGSMKNRVWDTRLWVGKNKKAKRIFGWRPEYDLQTGLKETVKWYRENPEFLTVRSATQ